MLEDSEVVFENLYFSHQEPREEPFFALVKQWIRQNEIEALLSPIDYTNRAYQLNSVGWESMRSHWNSILQIMKHFWTVEFNLINIVDVLIRYWSIIIFEN